MNGVALNLLAVGAGGFAGAILRYGISGVLQKRFPHFTPAGTLAVNVLGCLAIGVLMAVVARRRSPDLDETADRRSPHTAGVHSEGPSVAAGGGVGRPAPSAHFPQRLQLFLVTGILGSLTTFSTFGYETVELLREEEYRSALWNVTANLALGLPAVWLGWTLTRGLR